MFVFFLLFNEIPIFIETVHLHKEIMLTHCIDTYSVWTIQNHCLWQCDVMLIYNKKHTLKIDSNCRNDVDIRKPKITHAKFQKYCFIYIN